MSCCCAPSGRSKVALVLRADVRGAARGGLLCTVFAPEEGFEGRGGLEEEALEGVCPLLGLPSPASTYPGQHAYFNPHKDVLGALRAFYVHKALSSTCREIHRESQPFQVFAYVANGCQSRSRPIFTTPIMR